MEAGGSEVIRQQHLTYFVKLVEQAEPELIRSNQVYWINRLDDELDNLRMALEWALASDVEAGLRLVVVSRQFWEARNYPRELSDRLEPLLEHYDAQDSLHAYALIIYCSCLGSKGEFAQARVIAEKSLHMARAISDKQAEAFILCSVGAVITHQGDRRQGIPIMEQGLVLYKLLGDRFGQATATAWLGLYHNDLELSKAFFRESLRLYREVGHLSGIADCLIALAGRTIWGGDISSPLPWLEEARARFHQLGDQEGDSIALMDYGVLAYWQGDYQQACAYYQESIELGEKVGVYFVLWTRVNMAYALLRQGDISQAKEMFELCAERFQNANLVIGLAYTVEGLASLNVNQGEIEYAARLFAWADAMREKMGDTRPPIEQASVEKDLAIIHSKIDTTEFTRLSAEGRTMTVEQTIALALEENSS